MYRKTGLWTKRHVVRKHKEGWAIHLVSFGQVQPNPAMYARLVGEPLGPVPGRAVFLTKAEAQTVANEWEGGE